MIAFDSSLADLPDSTVRAIAECSLEWDVPFREAAKRMLGLYARSSEVAVEQADVVCS